MRIAPGTRRGGIRGARLLVRSDAASALSDAVSALRRARFAPDVTTVHGPLATDESPWVAHALSIGRPASRWSLTPFEYGDFPLNMVPLFWPRVAFTLAIACARPTHEGTELVIFAYPSMLRAGERTNDSGPLMDQAYADLQRSLGSRGLLLGHEPIQRVEDENCPASSAYVWQRLGWR